MNDKIFISHSSKDIHFVKPFVEKVLILGLDINSSRIFCSSMEGQGVISGQYIPDRLRKEIRSSSLALLFISQHYKSSEICLNEVGAAWAKLENETVIPFLLPDVSFSQLGFLDLNRVGLKITERSGITKFIQDCKEQLNPSFNLEKLSTKIEEYLKEIQPFLSKTSDIKPEVIKVSETDKVQEKRVSEWEDCFTNNLYALHHIIRKAIPAHSDGIHQITDVKVQNQLLTDLSKAKFLKEFWYKQAEGDFYVESLKRTPSGNWLISSFGWEVKITDFWVCFYSEHQYEFILIRSDRQEPYKIDSDIGGESYNVGILSDGTIISENERLNGYAIINGETIDVHELGVEPRVRDEEAHWIFLVSGYHKAGYNADETIEFCQKLDSGEIEVNSKNIFSFLRKLRNHPTILKHA